MNIHDDTFEKVQLAGTYLMDGAFHTAAARLLDAAKFVQDHADFCDEAENANDPAALVKLLINRIKREEKIESEARQRRHDLCTLRDKAAIVAAEAATHPWLDKKVKRRIKGYWGKPERTQRGIVKLNLSTYRRAQYESPRGGTIAAGEFYVSSPSGQTAYHLTDAWELDEKGAAK